MHLAAAMPTYNQREFIAEAVESVLPQVDELVIVDDGSTDGTTRWLVDEMTDYANFIMLGANGGTAAAINAGVNYITDLRSPDWLTWVSSDNVMAPHWRDTLEAAVTDDVGAVYSAFWYELPGSKPRVLYVPPEPARLISQEECYYGPSFIIRADVWAAAGEHRGRISHDYDHWLRVEEACWAKGLRIVGVPEPLCHYRAHEKRVTVTRRHEYDAPHWQAEARKRRGFA